MHIFYKYFSFYLFTWPASQIGEHDIGLALRRCELLLCRPWGESMTTEVRTNTFTSSEPLHTTSSVCVLRTLPPANTPCDTIDTDYRFCLLKNMLCGSLEMSGKAPRQQDLLGIYRSGKAAFQEGRGRERSACVRFIRMQPLFPISPQSKNLYLANLHTCVFEQIQSDLKLLTRFKTEYLPMFQLLLIPEARGSSRRVLYLWRR